MRFAVDFAVTFRFTRFAGYGYARGSGWLRLPHTVVRFTFYGWLLPHTVYRHVGRTPPHTGLHTAVAVTVPCSLPHGWFGWLHRLPVGYARSTVAVVPFGLFGWLPVYTRCQFAGYAVARTVYVYVLVRLRLHYTFLRTVTPVVAFSCRVYVTHVAAVYHYTAHVYRLVPVYTFPVGFLRAFTVVATHTRTTHSILPRSRSVTVTLVLVGCVWLVAVVAFTRSAFVVTRGYVYTHTRLRYCCGYRLPVGYVGSGCVAVLAVRLVTHCVACRLRCLRTTVWLHGSAHLPVPSCVCVYDFTRLVYTVTLVLRLRCTFGCTRVYAFCRLPRVAWFCVRLRFLRADAVCVLAAHGCVGYSLTVPLYLYIPVTVWFVHVTVAVAFYRFGWILRFLPFPHYILPRFIAVLPVAVTCPTHLRLPCLPTFTCTAAVLPVMTTYRSYILRFCLGTTVHTHTARLLLPYRFTCYRTYVLAFTWFGYTLRFGCGCCYRLDCGYRVLRLRYVTRLVRYVTLRSRLPACSGYVTVTRSCLLPRLRYTFVLPHRLPFGYGSAVLVTLPVAHTRHAHPRYHTHRFCGCHVPVTFTTRYTFWLLRLPRLFTLPFERLLLHVCAHLPHRCRCGLRTRSHGCAGLRLRCTAFTRLHTLSCGYWFAHAHGYTTPHTRSTHRGCGSVGWFPFAHPGYTLLRLLHTRCRDLVHVWLPHLRWLRLRFLPTFSYVATAVAHFRGYAYTFAHTHILHTGLVCATHAFRTFYARFLPTRRLLFPHDSRLLPGWFITFRYVTAVGWFHHTAVCGYLCLRLVTGFPLPLHVHAFVYTFTHVCTHATVLRLFTLRLPHYRWLVVRLPRYGLRCTTHFARFPARCRSRLPHHARLLPLVVICTFLTVVTYHVYHTVVVLTTLPGYAGYGYAAPHLRIYRTVPYATTRLHRIYPIPTRFVVHTRSFYAHLPRFTHHRTVYGSVPTTDFTTAYGLPSARLVYAFWLPVYTAALRLRLRTGYTGLVRLVWVAVTWFVLPVRSAHAFAHAFTRTHIYRTLPRFTTAYVCGSGSPPRLRSALYTRLR